MGTQNAGKYGRRARNADSMNDLGHNVKKAVEELTQAIKRLKHRVSVLERSQR